MFQAKAKAELTAPLSSAPCTPAPGRRIIIIRCDNPLSSPNFFVSFDRVVPPAAPDPSFRGRHPDNEDSSESQPPQKRRWNLLKAMFGGGSSRSGNASSSSDESDTNVFDGATIPEKGANRQYHSQSGSDDFIRPKTPHQSYTFRFSLEWMDRPQWPSKNKRLFTPCLPVGAQLHVQLRQSGTRASEYDTASDYESGNDTEETRSSGHREKPASEEQLETNSFVSAPEKSFMNEDLPGAQLEKLVSSKCAGRALAEWAQVVSECDSFFARRRDEGVPCDRLVETPTLGVESFRK